MPAPAWLPDLAEALGGLRLDPQRNFVFAGRTTLQELKEQKATKDDFYARFLEWFFADRASRRANP